MQMNHYIYVTVKHDEYKVQRYSEFIAKLQKLQSIS